MNHNKFHHFYFCFSKLTAIFITLFFFSCQPAQNDKISPNEREWLSHFFNDIMLFRHGIYTLWGAHKPITVVAVSKLTTEEREARYNAYIEKNRDSKIKGFSVYQGKGYYLSDAWEKWEQISHRFPMKRFMLFKQETDDPHLFFVVFVDIIKTAAVIQDNYEVFRKAMGFDFNPLELTMQLNQKDSEFWKKLDSYLEGLLFGFGKTNSQVFYWKHDDHPKSCNELFKNIKPSFSNGELTGNMKFTSDNFLIPCFASFNEIDPMVKIYKEERVMIKEIYKGKDFLDLTLQKLTDDRIL